jgi:hypothetical protein
MGWNIKGAWASFEKLPRLLLAIKELNPETIVD